jgi:hypothetical protein
LHAVGYGEDPVDPLPAIGVIGNESHDERASGWSALLSKYLMRIFEVKEIFTPVSP